MSPLEHPPHVHSAMTHGSTCSTPLGSAARRPGGIRRLSLHERASPRKSASFKRPRRTCCGSDTLCLKAHGT